MLKRQELYTKIGPLGPTIPARRPGGVTIKAASRIQRGLFLILIAVLFGGGLKGCSTLPSPLIVGETYTNFRYEFSMDIPSGWTPADDPEAALEQYAHWVDEDMASLVLTNEGSQGIIAVLNQKQSLAYPRYIELDERYWEYRINDMKNRLAEEVEVLDYDYHIYKDNLITTQQNFFISQRSFKPEKVFGVDARFVEDSDNKQMTFEWFLFPCQKDRSCQTIIMLSCREDQYEANRPAFESIVATLRAHDYYN